MLHDDILGIQIHTPYFKEKKVNMIVATFQLKLFYVYASKSSSTSNNGRVAALRKKSGKIRFFSGSEILVNFFNQVKEFLNPCSESLKSQGILSSGFCKLFYFST